MQPPKFKVPVISESDLALPVVQALLQIIQLQSDRIQKLECQVQELKNEVARLKKQKGKPDIKPSNLDKKKSNDTKEPGKGSKRPGSEKESKKDIPIHEVVRLKPTHLPPGSIFKGVREFDVQDIQISPHNKRYLIEEWVDADGKAINVDIPNLTKFPHFGGDLVSFILYQYHHCHVTHPLLLEQLEEFGVRISAGQLSRILTDESLLEKFHNEKKEIFQAGIRSGSYIQTDDTGARHNGKNGFATFVGNELFSWFESSPSKSRVNFLKLLQGGKDEAIFTINSDAFDYMREEKLPKPTLEKLRFAQDKLFSSSHAWEVHLDQLGIRNSRHIRIATKLLSSLVLFPKDSAGIS